MTESLYVRTYHSGAKCATIYFCMSSKFLCNQKLLIAVKMGNSMQKTQIEIYYYDTTRRLSHCRTRLESTIIFYYIIMYVIISELTVEEIFWGLNYRTFVPEYLIIIIIFI